MKYSVKGIPKWLYQGFLSIKKVDVEFEKYNGEFDLKTVEVLERGDSAAILLYQKDTNEILLVEQFRYPTTKSTDGWIVELVAGKIEIEESPEESIIREIEEEVGYTIDEIENIGEFYLSPGGSTERIYIFYAEVNSTNKTKKGGGVLDETEDIRLVKIKIIDLESILESNEIIDAKTVIALQWFIKNKK